MDRKELLRIIDEAAEDGRAELDLNQKKITELPMEIWQLTNLHTLLLYSNPLTELPVEVCLLTKLDHLDLQSTKLTKLPSEIGKLTKLTHLDLRFNELSQLPPEIGKLTNLTQLELEYNNLTQLPPEISNLPDNCALRLRNNPLVTPPLEVAQQGIPAIRDYFEELAKTKGQTQYLFESKLLIIGEGGSGKTSFRRKIVNPDADMPLDKDTTLGIEVDEWSFSTKFSIDNKLTDVDFNVNLWDFGGQKIYRGTHQIFFSDKCYYVLVADTREQSTDYSYWLNTVRQLAGEESAVLILINKKYGHEAVFDETGYKGHFGNIIKDVVTLDLSNDKGKILDLQETVKLHMKQLPGIGDALPPAWVHIREELDKEEQNFISFEKFRAICKRHDVTKASVIRTLSGYYDRIGVFTHYIDEPLLRDRIYLNSNWLVNTVYEVLDNQQVKQKKGRLTEDEINEIWGKNDLDFEIDRLTRLMHNFGLMYKVPRQENYVVPAYLPKKKPYRSWAHAKKSDILQFIYKFDKYMPLGLMSRLIVALHKYIKDQKLVWYRGVNIGYKGTHAELIETYGAENSFKIRIAGNNKAELLSIIRSSFDDVLEPFRNLNFNQLVPCNCGKCDSLKNPGFHDYDELLDLRELGAGSQCKKSGKLVDVNQVLKITEFKQEEKPIDTKGLHAIDVFLASSEELKKDREQVEIWVNRENKKLTKKGKFLNLILWEDFLDSMSRTRLQDEYNKAVKNCEIFLSLFATKVGKYTEEEFEIAHKNFLEAGKPKHVYTYFKKVEVDILEVNEDDYMSLISFRKKLKELEHFPGKYTTAGDLTRQLKLQLDKTLEEI